MIKKLLVYSNLHLQELEHIDSFIKMAKVYFNPKMLTAYGGNSPKNEITSSLPGEVQFTEVYKRIGVVM